MPLAFIAAAISRRACCSPSALPSNLPSADSSDGLRGEVEEGDGVGGVEVVLLRADHALQLRLGKCLEIEAGVEVNHAGTVPGGKGSGIFNVQDKVAVEDEFQSGSGRKVKRVGAGGVD